MTSGHLCSVNTFMHAPLFDIVCYTEPFSPPHRFIIVTASITLEVPSKLLQ